MTPSSEPRDVHLLQMPLDVYAGTVQWHADLMREFTLISINEESAASGDKAGAGVPARLMKVVGEMRGRYAALTASTAQQLEDAQRRGDASADVTYTLPREAAEDMLHLEGLFEEVDEFCRSGDLLTLAAQPEVASFRRWFLGEFARQLGGAEPTPWPAWAGSDP